MPELPDICAYQKALQSRIIGRRLARTRIANPFVLRTAAPPIADADGRTVIAIRRIGKRIVLELEGERFLVIHLMISGRLQWKEKGVLKLGGKINLAAFDFETGETLLLTEASTKKRASIHLVEGEEELTYFDRGGIEVLEADLAMFRAALQRENHTLKRALTDPRLFSGIGNAFSDEILHRGRFSPMKLSQKLSDDEIERLFQAVQQVLTEWIDRLDPSRDGKFPNKVTAFRPEMAVHGKYEQPCPVCGSAVQQIVYAENEANYCATCQTNGRLLADRGLSRLLKDDWPRSLEEMEEMKASRTLS